MIRHVWSVLCVSSSIDKDENKLSLFDVIEQVTLLEPYGQPGVMAMSAQLVTLWRREDLAKGVKTTARVRLLAPNGEQVGKLNQYSVDLTKFFRLRQRIVFRAVPVLGEGLHEFVVEFLDPDESWREVTRVPLDIVSSPVATSPASP